MKVWGWGGARGGAKEEGGGAGWVCVCVWKRNSVRIEMFFFLDFWKFGIAKKARQKGFGSPSAASFFFKVYPSLLESTGSSMFCFVFFWFDLAGDFEVKNRPTNPQQQQQQQERQKKSTV